MSILDALKDFQDSAISIINKRLLENAYFGFIEDLSKDIAGGADVNIVSSQGFTPLMLAANKGYLNCVDALIKHGADVNQVTFHEGKKRTAIFESEMTLPVVQCLIENGADIHEQNSQQQTVLILSCDSEQINDDVVTYLINKKSNLNHQDMHGNTALIRLVWNAPEKVNLIGEFIVNGADVMLKGGKDMTAVDLIRRYDMDKTLLESKAILEAAQENRFLSDAIKENRNNDEGLNF